MADATKAMHQLDGMDIAGNKIQVKIAALSPLDASLPGPAGTAAAAMAAATQGVDLDDAVEGARLAPSAPPLCLLYFAICLCFRGVQAPDTGPT